MRLDKTDSVTPPSGLDSVHGVVEADRSVESRDRVRSDIARHTSSTNYGRTPQPPPRAGIVLEPLR